MYNDSIDTFAAFPFIIENLRTQPRPAAFVPAARLVVTPALRTGGLLRSLGDKEARTLLALLTFLTPNGHIRTTAPELSDALGVPPKEAQERLLRLTRLLYQGEPLARVIERPAGLDAYTLSPGMIAQQQMGEERPPTIAPARPSLAGRDAIVSHSRDRYGTPRQEAERMIAEQLGHAPEESADTPEGMARRRLLALGVSQEDVGDLIAQNPLEEITQQLDWLPYRHAKFPERLIVAAIQNRYEPPARVRLEEAIAAETSEEGEGMETSEAQASETEAETVSLSIPESPEGESQPGNG